MMGNKEIDLAWNFVNNTNRNIFLTGKAGTGKTTFLHTLKNQSTKRIIVVAPTGVAAINAKGVTIHSFFQLPFGPILPNDDLGGSSGFNRKFSKTKIDIIKSLDVLVIDEISMVRADVLDGIDKTLRRYKNRNKVFGGVQLLLIGDLQQLSPVIKENEWELLKPYYPNAFFFSSTAYKECNPITIELKHIYRQDSELFITILNEVRNNSLTTSSVNELNKRFLPDFNPTDNEGYISLTTHNNKAQQTNNENLLRLNGSEQGYIAKVNGNFPEHAFPNEQELKLKVGAQVMFIKNDSSTEKRYFNGKIGKVIVMDKDEVVVHCPDDDFNIVTTSETWENIKYTVNPLTKAISEDIIGSYTQIPLRLAWSITIHKSQGLTFERAIIDAQGAFAHGQTYVALSRCKSLEGLVLKSKISPNQIISDQNVIRFNKNAEENQPNEVILQESKRAFQLDVIFEVFNFFKFVYPVNRILDIYYKNKGSIEGVVEEPLNRIKQSTTNLLKINNSFKSQLQKLVDNDKTPEDNKIFQERFIKALIYFEDQTKTTIESALQAFKFSTDNKSIDSDIVKQLDVLEELLETKKSYFKGLKEGFDTNKFLELRAKSVFLGKEKPKKSRKAVLDGTTNVELAEILRELRNEIADREDKVHYQIFTQKSLFAMCDFLPLDKEELKEIHGFGKTRIEKYGDEILLAIKTYCQENDIDIENRKTDDDSPELKKGESNTKLESLNLFKEGKSIVQIADHRELNENTIFGHLASFVLSGEIKITELISDKIYEELKKRIPTKDFETLSDLKSQLNDKFSYGEIKLVLSDLDTN